MANPSAGQSGGITAPSAATSERVLWLDALRAYAIVLMVLLHVAASVVRNRVGLLDGDWWIGNVFDAFARPCVPLFVMISGALLLHPKHAADIGAFFRRRFSRVFLPVLGWLVIYLVIAHYRSVGALLSHPLSVSIPVVDLLKEVIQGPVCYHLWYVYMLFGLYLAVPILSVYVQHASAANLRLFLLIACISTVIAPIIAALLQVDVGIKFVVATGYVGYFVAGYYLKDQACPAHLRRFLPWIICAMTAVTAIGAFVLTCHTGEVDTFFYSNFSPTVVAATLATFLWVKEVDFASLGRRYPAVLRLLLLISATSFSIYLLNVIPVRGFEALNTRYPVIPLLVGIPLTVCVVMAICVLVILGCRRIPYLRFLFP